jgi:cytochrome c-type biogenesis protein CcmH/NrfG
MLIANTVAGKDSSKMSETDKQTVSQAIQTAIDEAKAVVTLNPTRATNWELLATIYRSIMGVVQGADTWTVSAYQRAVVLDPQNPLYRVALGGILYGQKQYEDASRMFEVAVSLKPDWPNAQYNYAWALEQKGDYQKAANVMQNCVALLDPTKNAADYKKASADLEGFKQKLPADQSTSSSSENSPVAPQKETLSLPKDNTTGKPQITIPAGSLPSAK